MSYSYTDRRGNGVDRSFSFGFTGEDRGYIRTSDIKVFTSTDGLTYGETFGWTLSGTNQITFLTAPANGLYVRIRRVVDKVKPFSKFDRSITLDMLSLNNSFIQMLEVVHELMDGFYDDTFFFKQNVSMGGHKLTALAKATLSGDAVRWDEWKDHEDRLNALEADLTGISSRTLPYYYIATGGETRWNVSGVSFDSALVFINGVFQNQNLGAFSISNNGFNFAEPLRKGDEVYALVGSYVNSPSKVDNLDNSTFTDGRSLFRYKLKRVLPMNPPLIASVVASNGYAYLYPQAFQFGRNGDIYINMSSNGGIATWVAKYNASGDIVSVFNAFAGTSEVAYFFSEGGRDYYIIGGKGNLYKYDVTNLPIGISTQTPVDTYIADVNFAGCGFGAGRVLLEEQATPLGKLSVRNRLFVYNMNTRKREQAVTLPFSVVGAYTGTAYENTIHKTQGFACASGGIYLAHGKNSTGTEVDVVSSTGLSFCDWQGNAVATANITSKAMCDFLRSKGLPANRIECEGVAMDERGYPNILHAYLLNNTDPNAATQGIAISSVGESFEYSDLSQGAVAQKTATYYGKSKDGLVNPYTGEIMDTMTKILDYMANTDTQEYSFWTGTVTVTDLDGSAFPAFSKVKIYNQNGYSFFYSVVNSNTQSWWIASGSPYTKAYANFVGNGGNYNNFNTLLGLASGRKITTGVSNTILGRIAGQELLTGSGNTFAGQGAGGLSTSCEQTSAFGLNAGRWQLDGVTPSNYSYCTAIGVGSMLSGNSQVQLGGPTATPYAYSSLQVRSDMRDKCDEVEITPEVARKLIKALRPLFYIRDFRDNYFDDVVGEDGEITRVAVPKDGSRKGKRLHAGMFAQEVKQALIDCGVDFALFQDHKVNGGADVMSLAYEQLIPVLVKCAAVVMEDVEGLSVRLAKLEALIK